MNPRVNTTLVNQQDLAIQDKLTPVDHTTLYKDGSIRKATKSDLSELIRLETICFESWRRDSDQVITKSLSHPTREVWIIQHHETNQVIASLFLRWNQKHLHIYSLATDPNYRASGYGTILIDLAEQRASQLQYPTITIEADAKRPSLIQWYQRKGYNISKELKDFYASGRDAYRLIKEITHTNA